MGKTRRKKPEHEFYQNSEHYEEDFDDYDIEDDYSDEITKEDAQES